MKKQIPELDVNHVRKEEILKLSEKILNDKNYFQEYDINSLSKRQSNLLHFALSYKLNNLIDRLINEDIDLFKQNKVGMYPVFYAKSMEDFNILIQHKKIKSDIEKSTKIKELLFNDLVSPVYYWKPKKFLEFLNENKEMFSTLNDNSITFILNIHQLLNIELHEVWENFKEKNKIEISSKDVYLYILERVRDNQNSIYKIKEFNDKENERINDFKNHNEILFNLIKEGIEDTKKLKKIPKLKMDLYKDFYLMQSSEYEQLEFLYKEAQSLKISLKNKEIQYIEKDIFKDDLLYQWRDYLNKDKISQEKLKKLCEDNGLLGINVSSVFSFKFIEKLVNDLKKEALKVFPIQDKKLFADNAFLKITNAFGKNNGYLQFAKDKNVLNLNISDYSHGRENIFADELKDLKNCFVHEYTHYLQVVSEYHYKLNFKTNSEWLKVEDKILRSSNLSDNLEMKLKEVIREEFKRNGFEFKSEENLNQYLEEVLKVKDKKEIKAIALKVLELCPKFQRTLDYKNYMIDNLEFIYDCMLNKDKNLQKLYLDKLNKDEKLKDYYNDPVELHARLNEHLIKLNGKQLIKDFSFLSEEDNQNKKKVVMKDLKKFNNLIRNHLERLKIENKKKIQMS